MSTERIGVALIGVGMVAKTHVQALKDLCDDVVLRGVCARTAGAARSFADDATRILTDPVAVYTDVHDIAADPAVDLVGVLTPPNARLDLIEPLAKAGKAILLEKPIGRDLAEAQAVVAACAAAETPLGVFLQHRARAASVEAAARIQAGEFGALGLAEIAVPWWREQAYYDEPGRGTYARDGGGVLISQAIHTLDLALSLTGPVQEVRAMTGTTPFHRMEAEDMAVAGVRFAGGGLGWITASTASFPGRSESIVLHFERASLTLAEGALRIAWRDGRTEAAGAAAATGGGADPMAFTHHWHRDVWAAFIAQTMRRGLPPPISGHDALRVHALIDAMTRSAAEGCPIRMEES